MASSTSLCGICDYQHVSKPASIWCSDCDEGFCTDCSNHHRSSKLSRHHTTTPIENYQKLPACVLEIEQFCRKHGEKYTLFCKEHDTPCCRTCLQNHKQCHGISKIEDVVQNVKVSHFFQETEQTLTELAENITKIQKDREENLESIQKSKTQVETEIKEFRVKLNNHLDRLQEDIIKELHEAWESERKKMQNIIEKLQDNRKEIEEVQVSLSNIKQHASDLQAYLAMKLIRDDVNKTDTAVDLLISNENLKHKVLSLEINSATKDILSCINNFGNIVVKEESCNVVITKKKNQQAHLLVPKRNIHEITLRLQKTLNVNKNSIQSCLILRDDRLVFTIYGLQRELVFMNASGTLDTTLTIPTKAFDVIYVTYNNSLAISSGDDADRCITFININNGKVDETIKLNSYCFGIAEMNNTIFFCSKDSINSLNLKDKSITKFTEIQSVAHSYIDTFENNLYHTNRKTNTITCYDLSGKVKWQYKNENIIKGPTGISVDNDRNVYVAGYETSNVVVISPDGQNCRELLTNEDGLFAPCAIHFDRSTNNLLVANYYDTAFLYTVE